MSIEFYIKIFVKNEVFERQFLKIGSIEKIEKEISSVIMAGVINEWANFCA